MRKIAPLAKRPRYFHHKCVGIIAIDGNEDGDPNGNKSFVFNRFELKGA